MAKKTHIKVRMVPESKPDSPFFYYVKKPSGGEKAKIKLLGKGDIKVKIDIEVSAFSSSAKENIEKIGGSVIILDDKKKSINHNKTGV